MENNLSPELEQAQELVSNGKIDQAIAILTFLDDPRAERVLARLYQLRGNGVGTNLHNSTKPKNPMRQSNTNRHDKSEWIYFGIRVLVGFGIALGITLFVFAIVSHYLSLGNLGFPNVYGEPFFHYQRENETIFFISAGLSVASGAIVLWLWSMYAGIIDTILGR